MTRRNYFLCKIAPQKIGLFRFLLETRENLAYFTVIDKYAAIIKIIFAPESISLVEKALLQIADDIPIFWEKY